MKLVKITIETITEYQLNKLFTWNNDQEVTKFFKSKNKSLEQIKKGLKYPGAFHFMINENSNDIGHIFFTKINNEAYITIIIDKEYWGMGHAKRAIALLEDEGRGAGIRKFLIEVYSENKRAFSLYNNLGYLKIGVNDGRVVMEKKL